MVSCAECGAGMHRVPYMRDPHSMRVWLDRCPKCRGIWFDVGELEQTTGRDLHLVLQAAEKEAHCPRCDEPLREATVLSAPALGCPRCRGLHLPHGSLRELQVSQLSRSPPSAISVVREAAPQRLQRKANVPSPAISISLRVPSRRP